MVLCGRSGDGDIALGFLHIRYDADGSLRGFLEPALSVDTLTGFAIRVLSDEDYEDLVAEILSEASSASC